MNSSPSISSSFFISLFHALQLQQPIVDDDIHGHFRAAVDAVEIAD